MKISRRNFLKSGLSGAGVAALNLSSPLAHAFDNTCGGDKPHKALVGINLGGGNDGFNCFIPKGAGHYEDYQALRTSLAFGRDQVLDLGLNDAGLELGLSPELEELKWLFDQGKALPVVNVGPLMRDPTVVSDVKQLEPVHIYSHSHQSAVTQTHTGLQISDQGWGGLSAELLDNLFSLQELPPLFEVGSQTIWTNSLPKSANRIGTSLPAPMVLEEQGEFLYQAFRDSSMTKGSLFKEYYAELCADAKEMYSEFETIFEDENDYGFDLGTSLGKQLRVVLLLLKARDEFNHPVQFFSVSMGGFDTHASQSKEQGALLRTLASQLSVFHQRLEELGLSDSVTSFTFSEFGRTLEPNGSGTDHGWGNCQMVLGGDVLGERVLGQWPSLANGSDDLLSRGRVIPSMSVDLFHASLLKWVGVRDSGIEELFPSLKEFTVKSLPIFRSCDDAVDSKLSIVAANASAVNPNGIDKIEHAIDGNLATKWSAKGQNVTYTLTLANLATLHSVRFAQDKGHERRYFMDIQVSSDGQNFEHVMSVTTDGDSDNMVKYPLGSIEARYVRFVCQGNTDSLAHLRDWNNFRHIEVWGR
ncbi:DUF1501 domain-containing protein [Vibrio sp. WXL103]|uniref:DUF1501 domain-containing protein n=1 Tax=Vibrio sp. WXL103 TaxID=3450710 RepID=UPI003EC8EBCF